MGIKLLLDYLSKKSASDDPIDFIKLAKGLHESGTNANPDSKMTLVVDGESCLNRLYGGYYSDWICGGQWNRMESFICDLMSKVSQAKIEMVVFFNGAIEPQRLDEWIRNQRDDFFKMCRILNEVDRTSEAPKAYSLWTPPVGVRSAIRMKLREMNVNVVSTIDDHRQEVIAYCRENDFYGLIADDAEYIAFQPTRLFSAMNLKLRYRGTLETKEFKIVEFMTEFGLNSEKLCVLAALLGNYLLTHKELKDVYEKADIQMVPGNNAEKKYEKFPDDIVPKLAKFVNQLNVSTDLDSVVEQIFGKEDKRAARLKQSIQYYLNGTKEGFLKYRSVSTGKTDKEGNAKESDAIQEADMDTGRLATEKTDNVTKMMSDFEAVTAGLENELEDTTKKQASSSDPDPNDRLADKGEKKVPPPPVLPQVSHEVMRTLSERHSKGLMSPYIYQILSQGEIKLPVVMQKYNEDLPNIYDFYKPIRQMVYAIVFNLHHHKYTATKEKKPLEVDIRIKEWVFNVEDKIHKPEYVKAVPVGWGVPTIQRLWFGTLQDDKRRRLRAFLTCMRSDVQLILNPDFVPQELLMAAVVLRYIMSFPDIHILRKQELDAFIVTALTLESSDPNVLQDLKDPISSRNVQLAVLFMKGVEMALLVNDACGAPIPWLMCCPWLFFNGKLFNHTFQKAITCKNLQELCGSRLAYVVRAERMRQAILEGLSVQFARPPTAKPPFALANDYANPGAFRNQQLPPPSLNRSVLGDNSSRGKRSLGASLKVAGVVTSSWGANYNMTRPSYEGTHYIRPPTQYANNKKDNNGKRKPAVRGGRGRGRGGLTVGSSSTFTSNNLPNGNDTNPVEDKFDSTPVVVNGAAASTLNVENNEEVVLDVADDVMSTVAVIGGE